MVDDEPTILELGARILRQNGYVVLQAGTYEEALALATSNDFQLLLTDSVMPRMSGYSLAELIEGIRPGHEVLYMSGYSKGAMDPHRVLSDELAFLQKPFNRVTLLEKVHAALGR